MNATVHELLGAAKTQLTAPWESELLLAELLHVNRAALYCRPERAVAADEASLFGEQIKKRKQGWPIAYITGQKEFWSLPLRVTPDTLIPRPETETLVEVALGLLPADCETTVFDIGTGCGAVALALASERPKSMVVATDKNTAALRVAAGNRQQLGLSQVRFVCCDLYEPFCNQQVDLIVSNPPYLGDDDPHLESGDLRFEPRHALSAGADPLALLRRVIAEGRCSLKRGGWLAVEHGFNQGSVVRELFAGHGYTDVCTSTDLAGHERVTAGRRSV